MSTADFAARLRNRQRVLGYWSVIDSPVSTEWLAHIGWDYIALDLQHGLIGYDGMLRGLTAIDSAHGPAGIIRVEANDMTPIGRALDAGAVGVIVPLIDTADDAICAVAGLDAVYVGPSDLRLAVGGASPSDVSVDDQFEAALTRIHEAAAAAGIAAGIHTPAGDVAAQRLSQGYTFASVASDLTHLKAVSSAHLKAALGK